MHCLVTGAAGFIGSTLCDTLLAEGHTVRAVDGFIDYYPRAVKERNITGLREHPGCTFVEADLVTAPLERLVADADWVFHQAAQAGVRTSWGAQFAAYANHNILATQRLLEAARAAGGVKKFVYASSSSVYGSAERFPTSEDLTPQPVSPYGVSKLAGEHLVRLYDSQFGLPTACLRYFTVYGPRQRPDMAFHRFIRAGLRGEEVNIYGDGEQIRDFTFVEDIVRANIRAAEAPESRLLMNLGGGQQATVNQVLSLIRDQVGALRVRRLPAQPGDPRRTCADTGRAREAIGFEPRVRLEEGIVREAVWVENLLRDTRLSEGVGLSGKLGI